MRKSESSGKRQNRRAGLSAAGCLLVVAAALSMPPVWAGEGPGGGEPPGKGSVADGKLRLQSEVCQECHGEDGNSIADSVPKLAGLQASYIAKQIEDFRSGARKHAVMTVMASSLDKAAIPDIAAYFAANLRESDVGAAIDTVGRSLFLTGDAGRDVPPCAGCHGEDGKGSASSGMAVPALFAQHRTYLREQLRNWRGGERANSPGGVMSRVAQGLTDAEIDAISTYLSGL